jgi:dipeptidyl aminopeptidase/acylaminoacyl peptidase
MRIRVPTSVAIVACFIMASSALSGCSPEKSPKPPSWLTVRTNRDVPGIVMEDVTYRSGKLRIRGQVCRPADDSSHPVIIWNHGGFVGVTDRDNPKGACAMNAKRGSVYAESDYRGEGRSDGRIEVCAGEVDDVLRLLDIVRAKPYAQRGRVAMVGLSHGGCITTRAIQRNAPVEVAVDIAGPTDWARTWNNLHSDMNLFPKGSRNRIPYQVVIDTIEKAIGGTPKQYPQRYLSRSPVAHLDELRSWNGSFLIMHGSADPVVRMAQSCDLALRIGGFRARRVNARGVVTTEAPRGCDGINWERSTGGSPTFPGDRYLLVYDGVNHALGGADSGILISDYLTFIRAKISE